jgi:hypothetical protein
MIIRFDEIRRKAVSAVAALAVSSILVTAAVGYAAAPQIDVQTENAVA